MKAAPDRRHIVITLENEPVPRRVMIAGDWHGNSRWAAHVIATARERLSAEEHPLILQLGDFGVWPGIAGDQYLDSVIRACFKHGVRVWFIDGNHEDFSQVEGLRLRDGQVLGWLPRGTRWTWHGRTWLALGGAVSADRALRAEGGSWWPEEAITATQEREVTAGGPADVMITHDVPAGVKHAFGPWPQSWDVSDMARNDAHRERLQRIVSQVQPRWLMHGHLHRAYQRVCDLGYGDVEVTGLDRDDSGGYGLNYAVLDTKVMKWEAAV